MEDAVLRRLRVDGPALAFPELSGLVSFLCWFGRGAVGGGLTEVLGGITLDFEDRGTENDRDLIMK